MTRSILISHSLCNSVIAELQTFLGLYDSKVPLGALRSREIKALIHELERRKEQADGTKKAGA